jgi:hypothetical protein
LEPETPEPHSTPAPPMLPLHLTRKSPQPYQHRRNPGPSLRSL